MIALENVERSFRSQAGVFYVLRRISLTVNQGEFVTIMGPSGSGKTTLLNILGMLDSEWEGSYCLDGEPVQRMNVRQRKELAKQHIGIVFQSYHLLDDLTVAENLDLPLSYRNLSARERQALVADTLDRFGMVAKKDLYPSQLSGGQQQLVGVARALIFGPRLLLADEPTGNLHSQQAREIMELFRKLNAGGTTIIQVTHSEENSSYGTRIIRLADGWIAGDERLALSAVTS